MEVDNNNNKKKSGRMDPGEQVSGRTDTRANVNQGERTRICV